MPKRSDREVFQGVFGKNPFSGKSPSHIYSKLQWGNKPKRIYPIDAPEPLVALGELAAFYTTSGDYELDENKYFIAVGATSNVLYFLPINRPITHVPSFSIRNWTKGPLVKETHYYSDKGGEDGYYYHEHETPFPRLWLNNEMGILVPSNNKGKRSYAVIKEGIVG